MTSAPEALDLEGRIATLRGCLDLHGLDDAQRARLAPRLGERVCEPDELICDDDDAPPPGAEDGLGGAGLFCIVDGLVSVSQRSEQRRAPVCYTLGPGGLFGESSLGGTGLVEARAYRRSRLLNLPPPVLRWALAELPSFPRIVERLRRIARHAPWLVDCLRRAPVLRHVAPRYLYELLEGARLVRCAPGTTLLQAGDDPKGLYLVFHGELMLCEARSGQAIRLVQRGAVLGDLEFMAGRGSACGVVNGPQPALLLFIAADRLLALLGQASTFRRSLLASSFGRPEQRRHLVDQVFERERRAINLVALVGDQPDLPLATLTDWLAEASVEEFGDRIVRLRVDPTAPATPEHAYRACGDGELLRVRVRPDSPLLTERAAALGASHAAHYVFWDLEGVPLTLLPPSIVEAERTVLLASAPWRELPRELVNLLPRPLLYTAVVPGRGATEARVGAGSVRIDRRLVEAARRGGAYRDLSPELQQQVGRWARAITDRRVGLALGGGGAFGYAHLPLIHAVHEAGIPIDLVAGCSIGAVAGAFYCARGLQGLEQFRDLAASFGPRILPAATFSSRNIERQVESALGPLRLEDLLVPFYPVAVDIDTACQVTIRQGSVAFGVRASCSFPGLFAPTTIERHDAGRPPRVIRLVDGAVINLVPDDTLYYEGAQVAIASNVVPAPAARHLTADDLVQKLQGLCQRLPAGAGVLLREFDPLLRFDDCLRTMYIMMHAPLDWDARTAEAKFRARPGAFTPMTWHQPERIAAAQEEERIGFAVAQISAAYRALRWNGCSGEKSLAETMRELGVGVGAGDGPAGPTS